MRNALESLINHTDKGLFIPAKQRAKCDVYKELKVSLHLAAAAGYLASHTTGQDTSNINLANSFVVKRKVRLL